MYRHLWLINRYLGHFVYRFFLRRMSMAEDRDRISCTPFPCADAHETRNYSMALSEQLLHRISTKLLMK